jgi:ferredoxin
MRIEVDLTRCTGTANCVVNASTVFDIGDDDDQVRLLVDEVPDADLPAVRIAVTMCPQGALKLV